MSKARLAGALLCVLSLGGTVLLLGGIASGAYWAIAIPAALFVILTMGTLLWVGWTFIMSEGAPSVPRPQRPAANQGAQQPNPQAPPRPRR